MNIESNPSVVLQAKTSPALHGNLSTFDIVFTVLAYNAPLAVVVAVIPLLIGIGNGLGTPLTLAIAAGLITLFAVGFTTMTKYTKNPGAYYAYVTTGLGRPAGLGSAFIAILSYFFFIAGCYVYIGQLSKITLAFFNVTDNFPGWFYSLIVLVIVSLLGYFKVTLSAKVLTAALLLELILVFVWEGVVGFSAPENLSFNWMNSETLSSGSFGIAILFAVTCFAGFEATAVFREEARNPDVTVPRATYISILVMAVLFMSASYFIIVSLGPENIIEAVRKDPVAAITQSFSATLGNAGVACVELLMLSSNLACIVALHNIVTRYVYSLGVDGILPGSFGRIHEKHGSPAYASIFLSVVSLFVIAAFAWKQIDPYQAYGIFVGMAGYGLLLLQVITSLAIICFFLRNKSLAHPLKTFVAPALSLIGLAGTLILATQNLDATTGNMDAALYLMWLIYLVFLAGFAWAFKLKLTKYHVYLSIGRQV